MKKGKRIFILAGVFFFLTVSVWPQIPGSKTGRLENLGELRREIQLWNLVNGLELSLEQMKIISEKAREKEAGRAQLRESLLLYEQQIQPVLEKIKKYLQENKEIDAETQQAFHRLDNEIKKEIVGNDEKTKELAKEVEAILERHQIYQLQKFIPCIIPPKGDSRIGQAEDASNVEKNLKKIRDIPDRLYHLKKEEIGSRTVEAAKLRAPRQIEFNEEELKKKILAIYDEARKLDETEFEIQKHELAQRLQALLKPSPKPTDIKAKIEGFLLSPEIIPILEDRILNSH